MRRIETMTPDTTTSETGFSETRASGTADVAANLHAVRQRIVAAARRAGRDAHEITLVAVSKTKPLDLVLAAHAAGQVNFGENRLEEAWEKVRQTFTEGPDEIRWHFIGTIQSRKTPQIIQGRDGHTDGPINPFVLVHSVDRMKIAERLSRDATAANCVVSILLEVNVSGEESKHGFTPNALLAVAAELAQLPGLRIQGLMTMAPFVDDPEEARPIFRGLRELQSEIAATYPHLDWPHLSMGMTNDFEIAIEEGATIVRIGSAIFGERH